MGASYDFDITKCMSRLGIDKGGRAQKYITSEFMKNVQPYVPFDEASKYDNPGRLKNSCHIENKTDVVWNTPYARRLYYHPEYNYQGAPLRGGNWADRYLQNGGLKELEDGVRRIVGK